MIRLSFSMVLEFPLHPMPLCLTRLSLCGGALSSKEASVEEDYDFAALDSSTPQGASDEAESPDVSHILLCGNRIPSLSHVSPPSNLPSREDIVPMVHKAPRPMKDQAFREGLFELEAAAIKQLK